MLVILLDKQNPTDVILARVEAKKQQRKEQQQRKSLTGKLRPMLSPAF